MDRDPKELPLLPIDHSKIIDGFAELQEEVNYLPFASFCGICDAKILVTPKIQKFILEENHVPVKCLKRGAVYCQKCAKRKGRINQLKKNDSWREIENGKDELNRLQDQETELRQNSKGLFNSVEWPY